MAINKIFKEMFDTQKREKELEFQKEIIKKSLENNSMLSDFEKGMDCLEDKNYKDAFIYLEKCSNQGNSQAQYEISKLLKDGLGVEKNKDKAKKYLMESYKNGFKKSGLLLREIRHEEHKEISKLLKDGLGVEKNKDKAKKYLMESYKNGFKKSGLLLREIRHEEHKNLNKKIDTEFINKKSQLGFSIDIPKGWLELEPKNKNCFDAVAIDCFDGDVIFNIKMQVFLIEVPCHMAKCVSLDSIANNMGCIESVDFNNGNCDGKLICGEGIDGTCNYIFIAKGDKVSLDSIANNMGCIESVDFNNGNCDGKLICGEGIDGTCNYIFIAKGDKGVYDVRVIVDKYLEPLYEDIIDHIIYSFDIDEKIKDNNIES